jgi:foldase protein PrsA
MSEGNRVGTSRGNKRKLALIVAGTAVVLLVAGGLFQVLRPSSAFTADANSPAGRSSTSRAPAAADPNSWISMRVSRVGNEYISMEELARECVDRDGEEILENLINRKIIQQACEAQGIEISEAEVNSEIVKIAKKFSLAPDEWLKMLKAERKINPEQYRRDIIWPMLALKKLAGEEVKVTTEDLKKAFMRNYGPRVKARAIVLDNPRRARDAWEKVQANPEDFGRIARETSIDPNSRVLDGQVPPIGRYSGSEELEKAAFLLKDGEISGVIQVGLNQYIILKCEGRTPQTVADIKEVEDILRQELLEEKAQEQVAKVFQRLKEEARVDNYVTGVSSGGVRKSAGTATPAGAQGARTAGSILPTGGAATGNGGTTRQPAGAPARPTR